MSDMDHLFSTPRLPKWMVPDRGHIKDERKRPDLPGEHPIVDAPPRRITPTELELEHLRFQHAFEYIKDEMAKGRYLKRILREYREREFPLNEGRLNRWIKTDPTRWNEYCEAQQCGGEIIAAELADTTFDERDIPRDIEEKKHDFMVGKWYLETIDRKRFAKVTQVEVNSSINLNAVLAAANGRLIEHDANEPLEGE